MSFFVGKESVGVKGKINNNKKKVPLFIKIIGSIFGVLILIIVLASGAPKTFDEIEKEVESKYSINSKLEYIEGIKVEKKYKEEDLTKINDLYSKLEKEQKRNNIIYGIKNILPPRDGFNGGVANSVIEYIKENSTNLTIDFENGGNTLRLTNGLFAQEVRFKLTNALGNSTKYDSYFLIRDNGYTSESVVKFLETSNDFYDGYLKANKLEIATDDVYNYYFDEEKLFENLN